MSKFGGMGGGFGGFGGAGGGGRGGGPDGKGKGLGGSVRLPTTNTPTTGAGIKLTVGPGASRPAAWDQVAFR